MLKIKELNVFYNDAQAIWDVSFNVMQNSIVALVGSNGAGKSTILETISGFNRPKPGEIIYKNKSITNLMPNDIVKKGILHVPEGRRLFTRLTVKENLELGAFCSRARLSLNDSFNKVFELFPLLKERAHQTAGTLSGGEQQMLAVGRAIMAKPELLMLDEPSLGLAPIVVAAIFETIKVLNKKNVTILLVEQNVRQTLEIADYAYVLQTGHMIMQGTGKSLLKDADFQNAFLGMASE